MAPGPPVSIWLTSEVRTGAGNLRAVHQGLTRPGTQTADYLLLTDADIEHARGHLSSLVVRAESESPSATIQ